MTCEPIPRYAPHLPFPPYAFVPGLHPHPVSDPQGHSFGKQQEQPPRLDPNAWSSCEAYLFGIDLFNHGYYWEAHEEWESVWKSRYRHGSVANFLKALIKLAAAGVKAREGVRSGVKSHALRAAELFRQVESELGTLQPKLLGLSLENLNRLANGIAEVPPMQRAEPGEPARTVFDFTLMPG